MAAEANIPEVSLDKGAQKALRNYSWPGNVRELSNVLERTMSALEGNTIRIENLPFYVYHQRKAAIESGSSTLKELQAKTERASICDALENNNNNKAKAADMLGIHRTLLYKKMKKYGIPL